MGQHPCLPPFHRRCWMNSPSDAVGVSSPLALLGYAPVTGQNSFQSVLSDLQIGRGDRNAQVPAYRAAYALCPPWTQHTCQVCCLKAVKVGGGGGGRKVHCCCMPFSCQVELRAASVGLCRSFGVLLLRVSVHTAVRAHAAFHSIITPHSTTIAPSVNSTQNIKAFQ